MGETRKNKNKKTEDSSLLDLDDNDDNDDDDSCPGDVRCPHGRPSTRGPNQ